MKKKIKKNKVKLKNNQQSHMEKVRKFLNSLKKYSPIYLLISFVVLLFILTSVFSILWIIYPIEKIFFEKLMTMFGLITALVSSLIALIIPFQMKTIKKKEEKHEEKKILERIIQITDEIINYDIKNEKKQFSIFSGIDYIKQNKILLHKLNISLRANSTKGSDRMNLPIPPREIYDIIVYDNLTIRITIIATLKGKTFYKIENIAFYDSKENKAIDKIQAKNIFKNYYPIINKTEISLFPQSLL